MARSQEGYTSPHFSLLRKYSKYDFLGGWISFSRSFAREARKIFFGCKGIPLCPSRVRKTDSVSPESFISMEDESWITSGRSLSMCGQIGVITKDSTAGCKMGPPAEREYAVEPVGLATIRPSARSRQTKSPSMATSR